MTESLSFTNNEIQPLLELLEICIEYKNEREYCGVDWESVRNKYEKIQEKLTNTRKTYSAIS